MQCLDAYPLIVTEQVRACRDFYVKWFDFEVGFEASWFVWLTSGGERAVSLAFMTPDHPSRPPGPEAFGGKGVLLTLQVEDACAQYERLKAAGMGFALALKDEPWGQRRFAVLDPCGTWVDVVQQIEPQAGWWDRYMT